MNQIEKFIDHLKHSDFLEDEDIEFLLQKFPQARYDGLGYRVIRGKERDISQDKSFSKSQEGVRYFIKTKDVKEVCIYEAQIQGLDVQSLCALLRKQGHKFPEYVNQEQEVICLECPKNVAVIFQGLGKDF